MTNDSVSRATPDLRTFIKELEVRLNALSREELNSLLIQHSRGLNPRERNHFLAIFPTVMIVEKHAPGISTRDHELIADIEAFAQELEDGVYFDGWGWDDSIHDERAFGDESWTGEMDNLFSRASAMYLTGHRDLAGKAYGQLLHAFEFNEEVGHFSGDDSPESMVKTDITEAKARFLRCVYETSTPADRIPRMLDEVGSLDYIGGPIGLSDIINADTEPLPGMEDFLQAWIDELKSLDAEVTTGHGLYWWRPLLREAVVLRNGLDGLAELARESGDVHPEAYQQWVMALWQSGDITSAISVAREGVDRIVSSGEKARLADALATMAVQTGDSDIAVAARKQAWRSSPSLPRLLRYTIEGSPDRPSVDMRLDEEIAGVSDGSGANLSASYGSTQTPRLCLLLHLLASDYDFVVQHEVEAESTGWRNSENPGPIVFPFLALVASGVMDRPSEASSLAHLLDEMARVCNQWVRKNPLLPDTADEPTELLLGRLLLDTLACHPVTSGDRAKYLDMAVEIAKKRVNAIVSNTLRGEYEHAARLVVTIGETMALQGNTSAGAGFTVTIRDTYPRHIAFHRELEQLITRSRYLPSLPRRKK